MSTIMTSSMDGQMPEEKSEQQTLFSLKELTISNAHSMESIKRELRTAKEMLRDGYLNDTDFKMAYVDVKESKESLFVKKSKVDQRQESIALIQKIKDLQAELREKQSSISDYALEASRIGGIDEIEDSDGTKYKIVKTAKLVKVNSR